jgi:hypothetical protein
MTIFISILAILIFWNATDNITTVLKRIAIASESMAKSLDKIANKDRS